MARPSDLDYYGRLALIRRVASTLIEILGLLALMTGAYLLDRYFGLFVTGGVLVLVGLALDPPRRALDPPRRER